MKSACSIYGCPVDEYRGSLLCRAHRNRMRRTGSPYVATTTERFWASFERDTATGCWLWTRSVQHQGYGVFGGSGVAHRFSYALLVAPIPEGLVIDHLCRNKGCVNPAHLEPVTNTENVRRAGSFRLTGACTHGHEMTPENTYVVPASGRRQCRTCAAIRRRRHQDRLRTGTDPAQDIDAAGSCPDPAAS